MADSGTGVYKVRLEHLMVDSKAVPHKGTVMEVCVKEAQEPTDKTPNRRAGTIHQQNKQHSIGLYLKV